MMDAMAQWENQHFYEFGHSVGLALSKIALGGQMANGVGSTRFQNGTASTRFQNGMGSTGYLQ